MTIDVVIGTAVAALAAFEAWITYAGERVLKSYFTLTHAIATAVFIVRDANGQGSPRAGGRRYLLNSPSPAWAYHGLCAGF